MTKTASDQIVFWLDAARLLLEFADPFGLETKDSNDDYDDQ
jgi:hypothetical protein